MAALQCGVPRLIAGRVMVRVLIAGAVLVCRCRGVLVVDITAEKRVRRRGHALQRQAGKQQAQHEFSYLVQHAGASLAARGPYRKRKVQTFLRSRPARSGNAQRVSGAHWGFLR